MRAGAASVVVQSAFGNLGWTSGENFMGRMRWCRGGPPRGSIWDQRHPLSVLIHGCLTFRSSVTFCNQKPIFLKLLAREHALQRTSIDVSNSLSFFLSSGD
jgi:hypothetical protein